LIALTVDIVTNEPKAIQRTALTAAGTKIGRMTLGSKTGAAIKISRDDDVEYGLSVGEGLETMLAAMQRGFRPAWALGDATGVANFPVLDGIEALTIVVDNDTSAKGQRGQRAAAKCSDRWIDAGREVRQAVPNEVGTDFNDL
jgi:hypothetical protein